MRPFSMKQKAWAFSLFVFLLPFAVVSPISAEEAVSLPKSMLWSCYDVGSTGYVQASAMADAFLKKWKTRVRLIPSGTSIGRLIPVTSKKAMCGFLANEVYFAVEGIYDFATYEWGPQDLRVVLGHPTSVALATTKESGVRTLKDLKGKRVSWVPGSPTLNIKMEAYLAFAGLTWDDVKIVEFPSYGASLRALIEGKTDASVCSVTPPLIYELESSPRGLHWPPFPPDDKEGWKRMQKITPFLSPYKETVGAGISEQNPVWLCGYRYPMITVTADADAELIYNFVKALDQSFSLYEKAYPVMPLWQVSLAGVPPADAPFHEGAVRYLKEIGVWKQEHDTWNNARIAHMKKVQEAWEKALGEAEAKKMKSKDFEKFWPEERKKALAD